MIHRPDRVMPDIDNRLIPANAARSASNLRMGASIADTDMAITLVNGMAEIEYDIPEGDNLVIGINDREQDAVYFALYNSEGNHGLYRIKNEVAEPIISDPILNFSPDSDVAITTIDGKIYWTDNVNQPRMVNIQKGIDNLYPNPLQEWMITQIKRPPAVPLDLFVDKGAGYVPVTFTLSQASVDYDNDFSVPAGFQFAYYYVYDNSEESRLSPVSIVNWWTENLKIRVPDYEFDNYLNDLNLVKQVVFCFRIGNDGIWYEAKRLENISGNYVDGGIQYLIPNLNFLPKSAVSSDITNADFDAVPLKAVAIEVAQNRIDLGNYLIDYPNWDGLTLSVDVEQYSEIGSEISKWRTFKPGGSYVVGIQLLDKWRRKIGVVAAQTVTIPNPVHDYMNLWNSNPSTEYSPDPPPFSKDLENLYRINYTITGSFPDWAEYYEIVYSKALNYKYFNKSVCKILYWYVRNGINEFSFYAKQNTINITDGDVQTNYVFKGFAVQLDSGEPFQYDPNVNQYVTIWDGYYFQELSPPRPPAYESYIHTWKISGAQGNLLLIKADVGERMPVPVFTTSSNPFGQPNEYLPFFYEVDLWEASSGSLDIYWQSTVVKEDLEDLTGTITGDCYISSFKKINNGASATTIKAIRSPGPTISPWRVESGNLTLAYNTISYTVSGYFVSMNPTDIYSQIWTSDIGQANLVNENQQQKRILQGIVFSNPLIQGTLINGLSKFNSADNRQAPLENGPITALVRTNATQSEPGVLLAIGNAGVSSFYYDGVQLTNIDGTSNVTTSDKYLASQRPLVGNYGAERLSDICVTPLGTVYFWSRGIQDWIRYTNAGLDQLGEIYGFMNFIRNRLQTSSQFMMTYDQVTDEAILIGNLSSAQVFSQRFKTFQPTRDYTQGEDSTCPERGASQATRTFFFIKGHIWQMGPGVAAQDNSFFGEVKNPTLQIVSNVQPMTVKRWNQIKIFGPKPLTCQVNSENPDGGEEGLQSYIAPGWWIERKYDWEAAIRCDENSVGGVLNGKIMESRILISTFAWDANTFEKLNYIEVLATRSPVQ